MVAVGLNPMKEYCASFLGPSIDSRRYAFSLCLYSFEKMSRGERVKAIFLNFSLGFVLISWFTVDVAVPNTIPHFVALLKFRSLLQRII